MKVRNFREPKINVLYIKKQESFHFVTKKKCINLNYKIQMKLVSIKQLQQSFALVIGWI